MPQPRSWRIVERIETLRREGEARRALQACARK